MHPNRPCQCQRGWTGQRCENGIIILLSSFVGYKSTGPYESLHVYTMQQPVVKSVKMVESVFFLTIARVGLTGQDLPVNSVCILC